MGIGVGVGIGDSSSAAAAVRWEKLLFLKMSLRQGLGGILIVATENSPINLCAEPQFFSKIRSTSAKFSVAKWKHVSTFHAPTINTPPAKEPTEGRRRALC